MWHTILFTIVILYLVGNNIIMLKINTNLLTHKNAKICFKNIFTTHKKRYIHIYTLLPLLTLYLLILLTTYTYAQFASNYTLLSLFTIYLSAHFTTTSILNYYYVTLFLYTIICHYSTVNNIYNDSTCLNLSISQKMQIIVNIKYNSITH